VTTYIDPPLARAEDAPALARDRARYLVASGVALWGAQVGVVAVPLTAVTTVSADARGTALLAATMALPFLLLGLPVGAWLDRVRRRPVMIASDVVRAVSLATVPIAYWLDALTFAHLWVVVLVTGVATVFFDLGTQSHLKDLAPADQLVRANGRLATLSQTALICAPPLAGWAAGLLSPAVVLASTSAGYAWSAVWLSTLRTPEPAPAGGNRRRHLLVDIRDGVRFVRSQPVLLAVLGAGCLVNFGTSSFMAVLPVYAINELGWTESERGLYLGAGGAGGLLGALTANTLAHRLGAGRAVTAIGLVIAPVAAMLPLTGRPVPGYLAALAWALVIYKIGFDAVLLMSFRQAVTPSHLLGRVNGTVRVLLTGAVAAGAARAGAAAAPLGTRGAITMSAVALGLAWVPIVLSPLPRMSTLNGSGPSDPLV
jgi:predicted MFS family arabinose efflux permease